MKPRMMMLAGLAAMSLASCSGEVPPPAPVTGCPPAAEDKGPVRMPAVAGAFYPADAAELSRMVEGYIAQADPAPVEGRIRAAIAPHAGYVYSAPVAAHVDEALHRLNRGVFPVELFQLPELCVIRLDADPLPARVGKDLCVRQGDAVSCAELHEAPLLYPQLIKDFEEDALFAVLRVNPLSEAYEIVARTPLVA